MDEIGIRTVPHAEVCYCVTTFWFAIPGILPHATAHHIVDLKILVSAPMSGQLSGTDGISLERYPHCT